MSIRPRSTRSAASRRYGALAIWCGLLITAFLLARARLFNLMGPPISQSLVLLISGYCALLAIFAWFLFNPDRKSASESPLLFVAAAATLVAPALIAFCLMPVESGLRGWLTVALFVLCAVGMASPIPDQFYAIPRDRSSYLLLNPLGAVPASRVRQEDATFLQGDLLRRVVSAEGRPSLAPDSWRSPDDFPDADRLSDSDDHSVSRGTGLLSDPLDFLNDPEFGLSEYDYSDAESTGPDDSSMHSMHSMPGTALQDAGSIGSRGRGTVNPWVSSAAVPARSRLSERAEQRPKNRSSTTESSRDSGQHRRRDVERRTISRTQHPRGRRSSEHTAEDRVRTVRSPQAPPPLPLPDIVPIPPVSPRSDVRHEVNRATSESGRSESAEQRTLMSSVTETSSRTSSTSTRSSDAQEVPSVSDDSGSPSAGPPLIVLDESNSDVHRTVDADGRDVFEGTMQVRFERGQRRANLHIPLNPVMPATPDVECEAVGEIPLRLRVPVRESWGVRIEARRSDASRPAETEIGFEIAAGGADLR